MPGINRYTVGLLVLLWAVGMGMAFANNGQPVGMAGMLLVFSALYLLLCVVLGLIVRLFSRP